MSRATACGAAWWARGWDGAEWYSLGLHACRACACVAADEVDDPTQVSQVRPRAGEYVARCTGACAA